MERDVKAAADQAADLAKGLEEEKQRKLDLEKEDAAAALNEQEALSAALAAGEEKKRRQKELSRRDLL